MSRSAAERRVLHLLHGRETRVFVGELHAHILRLHLHLSTLLLSHFVSVCASLGRTSYAARLFLHSPDPDLLLFNSVLKAHSLSPSSSHLSLPLFSLLRRRSLLPDRLTFAPLLKSCSNLRHLLAGRAVHAATILAGFHSHAPVSIATLDLYSACDHLQDARKMFDEMPHRDTVVWNMMINAFCKRGDLSSGYCLFREMRDRNAVTWNSMISGFAKAGKDEDAMELFREMWACGVELDDATLVTVLPVCARLGALHVGRLIHEYAHRKALLKNAVNVANSLIDMYCKCGDLASASQVFDEMPRRTVVSWNTMINGLAFNGHGEDGLALFERMTGSGFRPNAGTFLGVLGCCTHAGMAERGRELFWSMSAEYGIEPEIEHYGCMVDLLGRCGLVREAHELIKTMPMSPSRATWGALLSSCRNYGDVDMAVVAAKELIEVEPWNSGNYVLLSNLYAEAGRWEDAEKVRLAMKEKNVQKAPGQSLIGMK
ncbi:hypothetical protein J5N97_008861 [Dioscorea zingiberensis]|uniref:Pentatricopeptide repeat-containing protein n=1 Tax=Dioscorea zingiberensis TaxID=325984 RepID=A0A9D5CW13_9LILI|nr:hypothetical protein J5N97_008861 [Dioscorea zingiberensis]